MNKKKIILAFSILILTLVIISGYFVLQRNQNQQETSSQIGENCDEINVKSQVVLMNEDSFQPEILTIQKCTKVIFKNQDKVSRWPASNLHPTHGIYSEFDPLEPIEIEKDWSFVFDKVGSWRYHDHLAPSLRGTIVVE